MILARIKRLLMTMFRITGVILSGAFVVVIVFATSMLIITLLQKLWFTLQGWIL